MEGLSLMEDSVGGSTASGALKGFEGLEDCEI